MNETASPNVGHSSSIVTNVHQALGARCRNMFQWLKRKNTAVVSTSAALPSTDIMAKFVPETRGTVAFTSPLEVFPLLRTPDHTDPMNICAQGDSLKRPRSREIKSCMKCIFIGTWGVLAAFFTPTHFTAAAFATWFVCFSK